MNTPQAILVGAILIAATILFASSIHSAEAQRVGPFQLMHHSNTTAWPGIFRLDTSTGDLTYCYITGESSTLTCTKER